MARGNGLREWAHTKKTQHVRQDLRAERTIDRQRAGGDRQKGSPVKGGPVVGRRAEGGLEFVDPGRVVVAPLGGHGSLIDIDTDL